MRGHLPNRLRIGTRGSALALAQTQAVVDALHQQFPELNIEIVTIRTRGDVITDRPLRQLRGKGFFVKEIESALLRGDIDIAVHSLKDMPTKLPDGLTIAAICQRLDPRDALVLRDEGDAANLKDATSEFNPLMLLPRGTVIGTSSLRRRAQVLHLRSDVLVRELRGNLDTRLRKLDAGDYDAIIVAAAGLIRMGLQHRMSTVIPLSACIPAAGQGALAVEARTDDERILQLVKCLDDPIARAEVDAERALISALGAGCHVPVGACARVISDDMLKLYAVVAMPDGSRLIRDEVDGNVSDAIALGLQLAERLESMGARAIIKG